jgi:hypothetical protein
VAQGLGLSTLQNTRHNIVACSAVRRDADAAPDTAVDTGMTWMLQQIGEDWVGRCRLTLSNSR